MNENLQDSDILMTSEAARELDVAKETVVLWADSGKLRCIKTARGRRLFLRRDVEELKREREAKRVEVRDVAAASDVNRDTGKRVASRVRA